MKPLQYCIKLGLLMAFVACVASQVAMAAILVTVATAATVECTVIMMLLAFLVMKPLQCGMKMVVIGIRWHVLHLRRLSLRLVFEVMVIIPVMPLFLLLPIAITTTLTSTTNTKPNAGTRTAVLSSPSRNCH